MASEALFKKTKASTSTSRIAPSGSDTLPAARPRMLDAKREAYGLASHFLTRRGYNILEQGWRYAGGSVDLVALDGDCLVLADVLMGDGVRGAGFPHESDVGASRERMEAAAVAYLREAQEAFSGLVRFDVVSILPLSEDRAFVRHHIGAFSGA